MTSQARRVASFMAGEKEAGALEAEEDQEAGEEAGERMGARAAEAAEGDTQDEQGGEDGEPGEAALEAEPAELAVVVGSEVHIAAGVFGASVSIRHSQNSRLRKRETGNVKAS